MTTTRRPRASIATSLAMITALVAAIAPQADAASETFTLTVTASCEDLAAYPAEWSPFWSDVSGGDGDGAFATPAATITITQESDIVGGEIIGEIDPGWVLGNDDCQGGLIDPSGDIDVDIVVGDGSDWLSVTSNDCTAAAPCAAASTNFTSFTLAVDAGASGTATATITVTWTP